MIEKERYMEEAIKITGVKPYYVKDNVVQNKGYHASRVVCKSKEDAEICCAMLNLQSYWVNFYKKDWKKLIIERDNLKEENKQLKKELFQSEKEYLYEAYADNSVRRDNKIKALEDEFNERFGDDWR